MDNVAQAVTERRQLDRAEARELEMANNEAWAKLPADYQWLKNWGPTININPSSPG